MYCTSSVLAAWTDLDHATKITQIHVYYRVDGFDSPRDNSKDLLVIISNF